MEIVRFNILKHWAGKYGKCICIFDIVGGSSFLCVFVCVCIGAGGSFRNRSHGSPAVYSVDGETLRINQVSKRHMAVYYCIASNGVPPSVSKRVAVTVLCELIHLFLIDSLPFFILVYEARYFEWVFKIPFPRFHRVGWDGGRSDLVLGSRDR